MGIIVALETERQLQTEPATERELVNLQWLTTANCCLQFLAIISWALVFCCVFFSVGGKAAYTGQAFFLAHP